MDCTSIRPRLQELLMKFVKCQPLNASDLQELIYVVDLLAQCVDGEIVQTDWDQTDNKALDYLKNKPIIPEYQAGKGITIDKQDPSKPVINADGIEDPTLQNVLDRDNLAIDSSIHLEDNDSNYAGTFSEKQISFEDHTQTKESVVTSDLIGLRDGINTSEAQLDAHGLNINGSKIVTEPSSVSPQEFGHILQAKSGTLAHLEDIESTKYTAGTNISIVASPEGQVINAIVPDYQAGSNVTINKDNPLAPIISATGGGSSDFSSGSIPATLTYVPIDNDSMSWNLDASTTVEFVRVGKLVTLKGQIINNDRPNWTNNSIMSGAITVALDRGSIPSDIDRPVSPLKVPVTLQVSPDLDPVSFSSGQVTKYESPWSTNIVRNFYNASQRKINIAVKTKYERDSAISVGFVIEFTTSYFVE